jgi:hypothetical protein
LRCGLIPLLLFALEEQESQLTLLELVDKHQEPLPLINSDYRQRLALAAAQKRVEGAEAQLAGAGGSDTAQAAATQAGDGVAGPG